jgi:hypothetical protein
VPIWCSVLFGISFCFLLSAGVLQDILRTEIDDGVNV